MSLLVTLAVEDVLTEAVAKYLIIDANPDLVVDQVIGHQGFGFLKNKLRALNHAAHNGIVSLVIADLDGFECPERMRRSWLDMDLHKNLIFRVAVREVESWLMADAEGMAAFLGIPEGRLPQNPDDIDNPKQAIVNLARRSKKSSLRNALVPAANSSSSVGQEYNDSMMSFIDSFWDLNRAMARSRSLSKAHAAVRKFRLVDKGGVAN